MERADWRALLSAQRRAVGLTQRDLAAAAGVSRAAIKAYEEGLRDPSRETLSAILDALKADRGLRSEILMAAGFASDTGQLSPTRTNDFYFSIDEAIAEMESHPWPSALTTELMEVVAANRLLQAVWRVDLETELNTPVERNILSVIALPRFDGRLVNWDEAMAHAIGVVKGHHLGPEADPERTSAYFAAVLERFMAGAPHRVARLAKIWDQTAPMSPKNRWWTPIVWDHPEVGAMRFHALITDANEPRGLTFWDWLPLDSATWQALERLQT